MNTIQQIVAVGAAVLIAWAGSPLTIRLAHFIGAVDRPDERKVHNSTMPRIGGVSIFLAFILPLLFILYVSPPNEMSSPFMGIVLGGTIVFVVGLLDDIYQLPAWVKLIGQCVATVVAISFGVMVYFLTNPFEGMLWLGYLALPITFLWILGITNAINLIDGLDGLAGGVSAIAALTMGIVALVQGQGMVFIVALILVAAIAGFLPWNFHAAKTFMGDCGSNFLGFTLACLAVCGMTKIAAVISLIIPILILGIPILDTFFAIVRRLNNRAPIFSPDKAHLHHRLMAMGLSHRNTVLVIYAVSAFFGALAVIFSLIDQPRIMFVLALVLVVVLVIAEKIGLRTGESRVKVESRSKSEV